MSGSKSQIHVQSLAREEVQIDFCKYNGKDFVFIVDRLTGYIHCKKSANQCTSSAILAVKHWASRNGLPYKIISDTGGALRDDFMKQLHEMGVNQHPAYGLSWFVKKKPVLVRYLYS